jgi:hypothetical protein
VTAANLLVLAPWLIFGAGLAAVCYRLLSRRSASHRDRREAGNGHPGPPVKHTSPPTSSRRRRGKDHGREEDRSDRLCGQAGPGRG